MEGGWGPAFKPGGSRCHAARGEGGPPGVPTTVHLHGHVAHALPQQGRAQHACMSIVLLEMIYLRAILGRI